MRMVFELLSQSDRGEGPAPHVENAAHFQRSPRDIFEQKKERVGL